jgi:hypothetical protein
MVVYILAIQHPFQLKLELESSIFAGFYYLGILVLII